MVSVSRLPDIRQGIKVKSNFRDVGRWTVIKINMIFLFQYNHLMVSYSFKEKVLRFIFDKHLPPFDV